MKLISSNEINKIKSILVLIFDFIKSTGFKQFIIIILFTKIWINLNFTTSFHFHFPLILGIAISLLVPIILLVSTLQYKSHIAYFIVVFISLFASFQALDRLIISVVAYGKEKQEGLLGLIDIHHHYLEETLFHTGITLSIIALLHNKSIVNIYKWKSKSFIIAMFASCILFLFQKHF